MSDSTIKIFYSWQSDLPGNETRNIIQDGIKDAVKLLRDTVGIEADRDTKGKTGSPDIAETIFSKIDECDIFIADVTAVAERELEDENGRKKIKKIPNPNVMLELGYATKVVGWENVICILNTDYGAIEDMPFDIAKRRLTAFSLKEAESKGEVKRYIRDIIIKTVEKILENGKRVKSGFSDLRIGCMDDGDFAECIMPFRLSESDRYFSLKRNAVKECTDLYLKIKEIVIPPCEKKEANEEEKEVFSDEKEKKFALLAASLSGSQGIKVVIKDEEREKIKFLLKEYADIDIENDNSIFDFGLLEKRYDILQHYSLNGTEEEEKKYEYYEKLKLKLILIDLCEKYITTFDEYMFLPLAIENQSYKADEDIDVYIKYDPEQLKVVYPSSDLLCPSLKGLESFIYEKGIIKVLLKMGENSSISYDKDISFSIMDSQAEMRARLNAGGINGNPRYTIEDYVRELRKYIATPMADNNLEFMFNIKALKPSERKWLGAALLMKPLTDEFKLSYSIKSKQSDGELSGALLYKSGK